MFKGLVKNLLLDDQFLDLFNLQSSRKLDDMIYLKPQIEFDTPKKATQSRIHIDFTDVNSSQNSSVKPGIQSKTASTVTVHRRHISHESRGEPQQESNSRKVRGRVGRERQESHCCQGQRDCVTGSNWREIQTQYSVKKTHAHCRHKQKWLGQTMRGFLFKQLNQMCCVPLSKAKCRWCYRQKYRHRTKIAHIL